LAIIANNTSLQGSRESTYKDTGFRFVSAGVVPSSRTIGGQFCRKFSEITVVILISFVALGAGNFPCRKSDEGNRVFFTAGWSHVLTKNYSVFAFRVSALDAIISVYGLGHVSHLAAYASRLSILRCNQAGRPANFRVADGFSEVRTIDWKAGASVYQPDVPLQINDYMGVVATVRDCVRERGMARNAS
jgi:hypothetical protein